MEVSKGVEDIEHEGDAQWNKSNLVLQRPWSLKIVSNHFIWFNSPTDKATTRAEWHTVKSP